MCSLSLVFARGGGSVFGCYTGQLSRSEPPVHLAAPQSGRALHNKRYFQVAVFILSKTVVFEVCVALVGLDVGHCGSLSTELAGG